MVTHLVRVFFLKGLEWLFPGFLVFECFWSTAILFMELCHLVRWLLNVCYQRFPQLTVKTTYPYDSHHEAKVPGSSSIGSHFCHFNWPVRSHRAGAGPGPLVLFEAHVRWKNPGWNPNPGSLRLGSKDTLLVAPRLWGWSENADFVGEPKRWKAAMEWEDLEKIVW